jgi:hypothetical protein
VYLLKYLRGTFWKGIEFSGSTLVLHIFSDADWGRDVVSRNSTTGFMMFGAGGPISWRSRLQSSVATSSMHAEYMAEYKAMQELVWTRGVFAELEIPICKPTRFILDSKSAKDLSENPVYHKRSKHIEIKYH